MHVVSKCSFNLMANYIHLSFVRTASLNVKIAVAYC